MVGICRLCASLHKEELLSATTSEICHQAHQCCQVDISGDDDVLPKLICKDCIKSLQSAFVFYTKVQEAQEALVALFDEDNKDIAVKEALVQQHPQVSHSNPECVDDVSAIVECIKVNEPATVHTNSELRLEEISVEEAPFGCGKEYVYKIVDEAEEDYLDDLEVCSSAGVSGENLDLDESIECAEIEVREAAIQDDTTEQLTSWSVYPWRCYLCPQAASNFKELVHHTHETHNQSILDMQFKCSHCQKSFVRYSFFFNHVRKRHYQSLAKCCDACDKCMDNYEELALHRTQSCELATGYPDIFICKKCGNGCSSESSLQVHLREQHTKGANRFACGQCNKDFSNMGALRVHERAHAGIKDYTCEQCGKAFVQKVNLEVHLYSHMNEKLYQCSVCKKDFKTSTNLEKHTQVHTDVKLFGCSYCDKSFRTKDAKLSHERTHTGAMPYKCEYCGKSFRYRSTLLTHINTHTGVMPYACVTCDHHFSNWSNYNKHMKRRHNITATQAKKEGLNDQTETNSYFFIIKSI